MVPVNGESLFSLAALGCFHQLQGGGRKPGGEGRRAQFGCFPLHIQHLFLALWKPLWARRHPAVPMAIPIAHPIDHCAPYVNHPRAAILIIIAYFVGWGHGEGTATSGKEPGLLCVCFPPYHTDLHSQAIRTSEEPSTPR